MLLGGVMIVDQKQFRMIAHSIICMNVALDDAIEETRRAKAEARIATQKFRRAMSVYKSIKARIKQYGSTRSCTMKVPDGVVFRALNSVSFGDQMSASLRICDELSAQAKTCANLNNANRTSIIDRIIVAASRHVRGTGKNPSTVYLGESEVRELQMHAESLKFTTGLSADIDEKVCDLDLVKVKKESYFAVH